ncbi:MFS transporter [Rhodococcus sp. AW25M09]|uniref:MFS transporter n=1 Tax=Rhodococcus sp. AW25M09 TaxID=1268303 RepID=UPI0002AC77A6|nr:MFS transporter [Rhodococcus sp. AW25M09]CCQ13451.1 MFS transporter [Rhodococcus sp. AW25M09]
MSHTAATGHRTPTRRELMKVRLASGIGSTIEWYLSFAYISAAGLIFSQQYFGALGPNALIVSLGSVAASFVASPLGGVIAGHVGDRHGRKSALIGTLVLMGLASLGMGLLPTYDQIGVAAPILLVAFRFVQGLSTGGEWGGAALMSVEYAPPAKRGFYGVFSQIGTPAGFVLSTAVFFVLQITTTPEQFESWGWRVPFLFSVVLVLVGLKVRTSISESPVFAEVQASHAEASVPLAEAVNGYSWRMVLAGGSFVANILAGLLLIGYLLPYSTTNVGMDASAVLPLLTLAAFLWIGTTVLGGSLADRYGSRAVMTWGYLLIGAWAIPLFMLVDTGSPAAFAVAVNILAVGLGLSYGPQSSMFAALFPSHIRYTAASLPYAVGGIIGGGFAPVTAEWLIERTGTSISISIYLMCFVAISLVSLALLTPAHFTGWPKETAASKISQPEGQAS